MRRIGLRFAGGAYCEGCLHLPVQALRFTPKMEKRVDEDGGCSRPVIKLARGVAKSYYTHSRRAQRHRPHRPPVTPLG